MANELRSVPLLELLVDCHHLDVLILLDGVPWSGVRIGPDDCAGVESAIGEKRKMVGLTMRATRKTGEIPCTTSTDTAYNKITMDIKSSPGSESGARRQLLTSGWPW